MFKAIVIGLLIALAYGVVFCIYFYMEGKILTYNIDCLKCRRREHHNKHDEMMKSSKGE